jgi:hypothetical protein
MKLTLQVILTTDDGQEETQEITSLERDGIQPDTVGLTLAEGKTLLRKLQEIVVDHQVQGFLTQQRWCPKCGTARRHKDRRQVSLRTVFGKLTVESPRLYHCPCQPQASDTFSPLALQLPERTTPELLYLETKFASLLSYGLSTELLNETLPVEEKLNPVTLRNHLFRVAQRTEDALGEEQGSFIDGCPRDWSRLPTPHGPLTLGIDGGFVRAPRKDGWFEVIVGKSMLAFTRDEEQETPSNKCFGLVRTFDTKPKRRLFELLKLQGMQMNQQLVFLSDGGESVRDLQEYLNPEAEHWLDWFHITMRLTVLGQYVKGIKEKNAILAGKAEKALERIKHYLWHGNVFRALQIVENLEGEVEDMEDSPEALRKLLKGLYELPTYIDNNRGYIPNFGERYRNGESISTAFVEATVNQVISKRFVKKQSMQWTQRGAHLLLQTRTRVLNGDLEGTFREWYPHFRLPKQKTADFAPASHAF